jgi:hypothetical protein
MVRLKGQVSVIPLLRDVVIKTVNGGNTSNAVTSVTSITEVVALMVGGKILVVLRHGERRFCRLCLLKLKLEYPWCVQTFRYSGFSLIRLNFPNAISYQLSSSLVKF